MFVSGWDIGEFVPIVALSIPIGAIIGGITAGVIRTLGRQRLIELAQRERIAASERGGDPAQLAPLPTAALDDEPETWSMTQFDRDRRRAQGLMIGGIVTLAVGIGLMAFLSVVEEQECVGGRHHPRDHRIRAAAELVPGPAPRQRRLLVDAPAGA